MKPSALIPEAAVTNAPGGSIAVVVSGRAAKAWVASSNSPEIDTKSALFFMCFTPLFLE